MHTQKTLLSYNDIGNASAILTKNSKLQNLWHLARACWDLLMSHRISQKIKTLWRLLPKAVSIEL